MPAAAPTRAVTSTPPAPPARSRTSATTAGSSATSTASRRYWTEEFASGGNYTAAQTRFFTGAIDTGCGTASARVGPFYCPTDEHVYLDLGFFEELQTQFGAKGGPFAEAYVVAHEYGHHVQDLLGAPRQLGSERAGPSGKSVRTELQADCYAGVWAQPRRRRPASSQQLTAGRHRRGARRRGGGRRRPDPGADPGPRRTPRAWTHGSSAQRQQWFTTGYQTGDPNACDTSTVGG